MKVKFKHSLRSGTPIEFATLTKKCKFAYRNIPAMIWHGVASSDLPINISHIAVYEQDS